MILEAFKTGTSPLDQTSITSDADFMAEEGTGNSPQQPAAGGLY